PVLRYAPHNYGRCRGFSCLSSLSLREKDEGYRVKGLFESFKRGGEKDEGYRMKGLFEPFKRGGARH
ncbi:MAG: hypothetical protein AAF752_04830, partial [Bacteroidota bacterium]